MEIHGAPTMLAVYIAHIMAMRVFADRAAALRSQIPMLVAPVASGWSDGRVELAPTGKAPPYHGAHPIRTFSGLCVPVAIHEREGKFVPLSWRI